MHYLKSEEKKKSRQLWEEAFDEDSQAFCDYYYSEKTRDNQILVIEEEGRILSMLHRNPYVLQVENRRWNCDYIVGVATSSDQRRQGYMRRLMEKCLTDMRKEHMPFCFLMPAFEALYTPFGFTYMFDKPKWQLSQTWKQKLERKTVLPGEEEAAAQWMNRWLTHRYKVFAVRDEAYVHRLAKELESENGTMEWMRNGTETAGIFAQWGIEKKEQRILYCQDKYVEKDGEALPCIMGRIVDLEEFMSAISLSEDASEDERTVFLEVQDEQIAENAGIWKWTLNKETSVVKKVSSKEEEASLKAASIEKPGKSENPTWQPDLMLDIRQLTAWLMGYAGPDGGWKGIREIRTLSSVFLDEVV